jgi:hypothetical protein
VSARHWIGWWPTSRRAGVGYLSCGGRRASALSALVQYLVWQAAGFRVVRVVGVESEMEMAFAGLHQLCAPMLRHLDRLPGPQRDALCIAFGLNAGSPPDRFLVGLAVLSLVAEAAEEQALLCVVDDAQWLDRVSAQTLAFVGRRLLAERVALVFAVREAGVPLAPDDDQLIGLPEFAIRGLRVLDARALLEAAVPGRLDERVRDRIVAETRGNPLALLELPRGLTAAELAGGFVRPDARPLSGRIEQSFLRRIEALPVATQQLLLVAAADPVGDVPLLRRVAQQLAIGMDAAAPAEEARLIELGPRVRFRHPLVRSAAYRTAEPAGPPGSASRIGRGDRSPFRPGSPSVASGPRRGGAGRGRGRRTGAIGRPGPGPRRRRGFGRIPAASRRADAGFGPARGTRAGCGADDLRCRRTRRGTRAPSPPRRSARWTSFVRRSWSASVPR